jgi:hypothetical protein
VALAQDIKITTRHLSEPTYQVDFDDQWLADDDCMLPVYEVDAGRHHRTRDDRADARNGYELPATLGATCQ